jgi:hypothetical protein
VIQLGRMVRGFVLALPLVGCSEVTVPQEDDDTEPQILVPCTIDGVAKPTLCGWYNVSENRAAPTGRVVRFRIVVAKALGAGPEPDPIIYFEGGPGGSSTSVAPFLTAFKKNFGSRRIPVVCRPAATEADPVGTFCGCETG